MKKPGVEYWVIWGDGCRESAKDKHEAVLYAASLPPDEEWQVVEYRPTVIQQRTKDEKKPAADKDEEPKPPKMVDKVYWSSENKHQTWSEVPTVGENDVTNSDQWKWVRRLDGSLVKESVDALVKESVDDPSLTELERKMLKHLGEHAIKFGPFQSEPEPIHPKEIDEFVNSIEDPPPYRDETAEAKWLKDLDAAYEKFKREWRNDT